MNRYFRKVALALALGLVFCLTIFVVSPQQVCAQDTPPGPPPSENAQDNSCSACHGQHGISSQHVAFRGPEGPGQGPRDFRGHDGPPQGPRDFSGHDGPPQGPRDFRGHNGPGQCRRDLRGPDGPPQNLDGHEKGFGQCRRGQNFDPDQYGPRKGFQGSNTPWHGPRDGFEGRGRHRPPNPEMRFQAMDANNDGVLSKEEFLGFHERNRPPHSPMNQGPADQKPPFPMEQQQEPPRPEPPDGHTPPPPPGGVAPDGTGNQQ